MSTINQNIRKRRGKKKRDVGTSGLEGNCQQQAVCTNFEIRNPKKPNSGNRKIARVSLRRNGKPLIAYIPGQGHTLQKFSSVIVEGGRANDTPGVRYTLTRGRLDFVGGELIVRTRKRSKFGDARPV